MAVPEPTPTRRGHCNRRSETVGRGLCGSCYSNGPVRGCYDTSGRRIAPSHATPGGRGAGGDDGLSDQSAWWTLLGRQAGRAGHRGRPADFAAASRNR
jgi:hypothetical protein